MHVVLAAVDEPLVSAWERYCGDLPDVSVHHGSILEVVCDAVVSPANSFGFMDGGIDMLYSQYFGWQVQQRLQQRIVERHFGELLVGTAEIVETGHSKIPYLIAAPTMRVPMILQNSVNPYLAARATLLLVQQGVFEKGIHQGRPVREVVQTVAFPGLGTGVGRIGPATCALQVRAAIEEVLLSPSPFPASWHQAQQRHQRLYTTALRDLQYE